MPYKQTHDASSNSRQITILPIKTERIEAGDDLKKILRSSLRSILEDGDLLVVTSKIVALCEKRVIKKDLTNPEQKHQLVADEADYYLPPSSSKYNLMLTILNNNLGVNAGIDESNVNNDYYVLLPKNPYQSALNIWQFCRSEFGIKNLGVIISDSRSAPLKWGVFGTSLAHAGFIAMHDKRGDKDLYGRELKMTQINIAESAAQAAVFAMGEGSESQPLAIVHNVSNVEFTEEVIDREQQKSLMIDLEDDLYNPILSKVDWKSKK